MLGKTHLTVGIAAAIAAAPPESFNECMTVLVGGAVGGVLADIDIFDTEYKNEAVVGQEIAGSMSAVALLTDYFLGLGICSEIVQNAEASMIWAGVLIVLCVIGYMSSHRSFTHSVAALILYSVAVGMIYRPFALPFFAAYSSHLILDVMNKRKIQLLFPLKSGVCLNWFYAGKKADKMLMNAGLCVSAVLLVIYAVIIPVLKQMP